MSYQSETEELARMISDALTRGPLDANEVVILHPHNETVTILRRAGMDITSAMLKVTQMLEARGITVLYISMEGDDRTSARIQEIVRKHMEELGVTYRADLGVVDYRRLLFSERNTPATTMCIKAVEDVANSAMSEEPKETAFTKANKQRPFYDRRRRW